MIPQDLKTIIDLTIGDGYIGFNGKSMNGRIEHSIKQKEYAQHKEQILRDLQIPLSSREFTVKTGKNAGRSYYQINLNHSDILRTARKWLYNKGKKGLDKALFKQLDNISLAYWFMDDGSAKLVKYNQKGDKRYIFDSPKIGLFKFSNQSFDAYENSLMIEWLKEQFDITAHLVTNNGNELHISDIENKQRFLDVVKPYIIPSMFYKIQYPLSFDGIGYHIIQRERLSESNPTGYATV